MEGGDVDVVVGVVLESGPRGRGNGEGEEGGDGRADQLPGGGVEFDEATGVEGGAACKGVDAEGADFEGLGYVVSRVSLSPDRMGGGIGYYFGASTWRTYKIIPRSIHQTQPLALRPSLSNLLAKLGLPSVDRNAPSDMRMRPVTAKITRHNPAYARLDCRIDHPPLQIFRCSV